jgi:tetratricopeptide (TPR) repeat protein
MLHTDAALRVLDDEARGRVQLTVAGQLLRMGGEGLHSFARTWYVTVSRALRDRTRLSLAEGLLERARKHLPGDPIVLYESGVLEEQIATFSAFITETVTEIPVPRSPGGGQVLGQMSGTGTNRNVVEWRRTLGNAAEWLRNALEAHPTSELAQLHLGRVQGLRGNYDEAAKLLQPLAASTTDTETAYLATMFLGALHERRGRHNDAEQMYRRAAVRIPASQVSYVALSEVLLKLGRGDESRDVLLDLLRRPAETRTEPWWWYLGEPIEDAKRRLDALRGSVRK